jgi:hypothetical protein
MTEVRRLILTDDMVDPLDEVSTVAGETPAVSALTPDSAAEPSGKACIRTEIPLPRRSGHVDRVAYMTVHFYGSKLYEPLAEAAEYLWRAERANGRTPHVLCVHDEFSAEDGDTDLAWRVSLVISDASGEPS